MAVRTGGGGGDLRSRRPLSFPLGCRRPRCRHPVRRGVVDLTRRPRPCPALLVGVGGRVGPPRSEGGGWGRAGRRGEGGQAGGGWSPHGQGARIDPRELGTPRAPCCPLPAPMTGMRTGGRRYNGGSASRSPVAAVPRSPPTSSLPHLPTVPVGGRDGAGWPGTAARRGDSPVRPGLAGERSACT